MKQDFCLTKEEKDLGLNPDWVVYAKASPELKAVLNKAITAGYAERLNENAEVWFAVSADWKLFRGLVYRVRLATPVSEPAKPAAVRVELKWFASAWGAWGAILGGKGFWAAGQLCCCRGFIEYEYPDGSRSMDFTRSKGLPVAAWFEEEPA